MIEAQALINLFQRMYREHWSYKWGAAQTGCVDCAGAFVWAYKQFGQSIYHGSNRIARVYVVELLPISKAEPGMAAFKVRHPGQRYYDLRSEYKKGGKYYNGDISDFYHIGLVDTDTRYVLNAQSAKTGFVRSKIVDNWAYVAKLKAVSYEDKGGDGMSETNEYVVTANKVNMRAAPDKKAERVEYLNTGDIVTVGIEYGNGWDYVVHGKKSGYVMAEYLRPVDGENKPVEPPVISSNEDIVKLICEALEANKIENEKLVKLQELLTNGVG